MYARKTHRLFAAAALFTLLAGAASASTPKQAMPLTAAVQPQMTLAQPVIVLIGTASLEEYSRSNPADRSEITRTTSEITRTTMAQRPLDNKATPCGTARS